MVVNLILRKTTQSFEEQLRYSQKYEKWQTNIGQFFYYYFYAPEKQFQLQIVDFSILAGGPFDCSGPPMWVQDIKPIALIALAGKPAHRLYGAGRIDYSIGNLPAFFDTYNTGSDSIFSRMCEKDQTQNRNNPQKTLERLCEVHKPDMWSWEQIIDLVYENITKARNVLLDSAQQISNGYVTQVMGDLELERPNP